MCHRDMTTLYEVKCRCDNQNPLESQRLSLFVYIKLDQKNIDNKILGVLFDDLYKKCFVITKLEDDNIVKKYYEKDQNRLSHTTEDYRLKWHIKINVTKNG